MRKLENNPRASAIKETNDQMLARINRRRKLFEEIDWLLERTIEDFDSIFQFVMTKGLQEMNADYGHIVVKKDDDLEIKYSNSSNMVGTSMPFNESLCGSVFDSGNNGIIADTQVVDKHYYILHKETRSEIAIPIRDFRQVKTFGILNIEWKIENGPTKDSIEFCELLSRKIALAWEEHKLWQGVLLISELSTSLLANVESAEVYNDLLKKILNLLDLKFGQILILNEDELIIVASSNKQEVNLIVDKNSVCGDYILTHDEKEPLKIDNISKSKYKGKYLDLLGKNSDRETEMRSEFVVPLVAKKKNSDLIGATIGAINIEDPRVNAFSEFDVYVISIFGRLIANAIEASEDRRRNQDMEAAREMDMIIASQSDTVVDFLHQFGGVLGTAAGRLSEFIDKTKAFDDQLPAFSKNSSHDFLKSILDNIQEVTTILSTFKKEIDPANASGKPAKMFLVDTVIRAIERAQKNCDSTIYFNFDRDVSVTAWKVAELQLSNAFDSVLDCLLNNAIDAMPDGGNILIEAKLVGPFTAQIRITDSGVGMSDEILNKLFVFGHSSKKDIFKRLGGGMGLWRVKLYLARFKSQIKVKSKLGSGTTFIITIPVKLSNN